MPVATTTPAGRAVMMGNDPRLTENASAKLARKREEAKRAAAALNGDAPLFDEAPVTAPQVAKPVFTIHALIDDFPFDVCFSGSADQLAATVQRLRDLGAVPPTPAARAAVEAEKERSAPVCKCDACDRYGKPMKESTKNVGSHYCPGSLGQKAGKPIYCKETA